MAALSEIDLHMKREVIALGERCQPIKDCIPKVGAIIALGGTIIGRGLRGFRKPQPARLLLASRSRWADAQWVLVAQADQLDFQEAEKALAEDHGSG